MIEFTKTIAAVVVTHNRKKLLLECVAALLSQLSVVKPHVIVVDNASEDGTHEVLCERIESGEIDYVNTGANLGGAGGFNFGMRYAAERGFDYIWVMDDDCIPEPDAMFELLVADEGLGSDYGFLSSKVLWKDGSICKMNVQRETVFRSVMDFDSALLPVEMASFVSLFVPTRIVRELGLPIKEFFIWTDDWEFTRRISRKYPCYLVNGSVVVHKSASNTGANIAIESEERLGRFLCLYRNDVYLYRREGIKGFGYECVRICGHALRILTKAKGGRFKRISHMLRGTVSGLTFKPAIEYPEGADSVDTRG